MRPIGDIPRAEGRFRMASEYRPAGDQPAAIDELERRVRAGERNVVLLGATGTGKSATTAWLIERLQRPTLVMAPNKTLAAQLANELREMLPNNAVEYFVSYYDYYQPEAYIAQSDTYIEKDSSRNEDIDRMRHSATSALLTRRDVIVVASEGNVYRVEFFGDEVGRIRRLDPMTGEILESRETLKIFPASHYVTPRQKLELALTDIEQEMEERCAWFDQHGRLLEAQRLRQRTNFDLEMLRETGTCHGVENYSRHLARRPAGSRPWTLLDYFPPDFLAFIDESHISIPQVRGMYFGDRSRKEILVEYGFRLPSALDNRPLTFEEFEQRLDQTIFVSATPGPYEIENSKRTVEQII